MIYNIYLNISVKVFILNKYIIIGPIGAGKSEAKIILQDNDYKCFCADEEVKKLYKDKSVIEKIHNFLPSAVNNKGIDLNILRNEFFNNPELMEKIENYIQPIVYNNFINIEKENKNNIIFIFPIVKNNKFILENKYIYINSDVKIRRDRLKKRANYNDLLISKIINYQESIDIYKKDCDYLINNDGTINELRNSLKKIIK